jgi:hypothetical protein
MKPGDILIIIAMLCSLALPVSASSLLSVPPLPSPVIPSIPSVSGPFHADTISRVTMPVFAIPREDLSIYFAGRQSAFDNPAPEFYSPGAGFPVNFAGINAFVQSQAPKGTTAVSPPGAPAVLFTSNGKTIQSNAPSRWKDAWSGWK